MSGTSISLRRWKKWWQSFIGSGPSRHLSEQIFPGSRALTSTFTTPMICSLMTPRQQINLGTRFYGLTSSTTCKESTTSSSRPCRHRRHRPATSSRSSTESGLSRLRSKLHRRSLMSRPLGSGLGRPRTRAAKPGSGGEGTEISSSAEGGEFEPDSGQAGLESPRVKKIKP